MLNTTNTTVLTYNEYNTIHMEINTSCSKYTHVFYQISFILFIFIRYYILIINVI